MKHDDVKTLTIYNKNKYRHDSELEQSKHYYDKDGVSIIRRLKAKWANEASKVDNKPKIIIIK